MQFRILTLNIWGVHYVAKNIQLRIDALIRYLRDPENFYDIIALQELWSKKDFIYIRDHIRLVYPHSYYFLSGLIGSGCCVFSRHPIVGVYEHRYTLNGFPHKVQHGDYFGGKLIGLCKILIDNHYRVNVYTTHLHANYHQVIPKDIYLGHRVCQSYEVVQFIESTSGPETTDLTILLGDLNLKPEDSGFKLIQGILQLKDSFLDRRDGSTCDSEVGNEGYTTSSLDHPKGMPLQGERIDHILYRGRNDSVTCRESYPTMYKIPGNPRGLTYSDHLAVYALLETNDQPVESTNTTVENPEQLTGEAREELYSACRTVEMTIQRLQRERIQFFCGFLFLLLLLFIPSGNPATNNYFFTIFIIIKNLLCIIGIVLCVWALCFGKPTERNALSAVLNAMRIRLGTPQFTY